MKFTKQTKTYVVSVLYALLVLTFCFIYFIVYRTESRVYWYKEMYVQSENMIKEFKESVHMN